MIEVDTIDTVVIGDVHGSASKLEAVLNRFGEDVRYVLLGDIIDGGEGGKFDVMHTMDLVEYMVNQLGGVALKANHEWVLDAAMHETDPDSRNVWLNEIWRTDLRYGLMRGYEKNTLKSYDVDPDLPNGDAIKLLKEEMDHAGHTDIIRRMPLYYEGADFLIVHAGLTEAPWTQQKEDLDDAEAEISGEEPSFTSEPMQIFDELVYTQGKKKKQQRYAPLPYVPTAIGGKTLITGHAHMDLSPEDRVTQNGRRVRLAGMHGGPLYVWQSWNHEVVAVEKQSSN